MPASRNSPCSTPPAPRTPRCRRPRHRHDKRNGQLSRAQHRARRPERCCWWRPALPDPGGVGSPAFAVRDPPGDAHELGGGPGGGAGGEAVVGGDEPAQGYSVQGGDFGSDLLGEASGGGVVVGAPPRRGCGLAPGAGGPPRARRSRCSSRDRARLAPSAASGVGVSAGCWAALWRRGGRAQRVRRRLSPKKSEISEREKADWDSLREGCHAPQPAGPLVDRLRWGAGVGEGGGRARRGSRGRRPRRGRVVWSRGRRR